MEKWGYNLQTVHKKINLADPTVPWEHEQFSKQKVVGGTLSSLETASSPLLHSSLMERE